jgi:hypothetical protein
MKNDGHIKITRAAIQLMQSDCAFEKRLCHLPMFTSVTEGWKNAKTSNNTDVVTAFVSYLLNRYAYNPNSFDPRRNLARRVAAIDFDFLPSHADPEGQRFHFMRANGESEITSYTNACEFIKYHTGKWIQQAFIDIEQMKRKSPSYLIMRTGVEYLSLALHCLQDSFSPAHVIRSWSRPDTYKELVEPDDNMPSNPGDSSNPAPIVRIFNYGHQKHGSPFDANTPHSKGDILSGSISSPAGRLAVYATKDLIELGLTEIFSKRPLINWDRFQKKWLKQNFILDHAR